MSVSEKLLLRRSMGMVHIWWDFPAAVGTIDILAQKYLCTYERKKSLNASLCMINLFWSLFPRLSSIQNPANAMLYTPTISTCINNPCTCTGRHSPSCFLTVSLLGSPSGLESFL